MGLSWHRSYIEKDEKLNGCQKRKKIMTLEKGAMLVCQERDDAR
jgi:hypothetical protein